MYKEFVMVSTLSLTGMVFSFLLAVSIPVLMAIFFYKRFPYRISSLFIGAAVFIVSQFILRQPLLRLLTVSEWHKAMSSNFLYLVVFYALSAGLFEESGRYVAFRLNRKQPLDWSNAVAMGIGHGGIEAILLAGLSQLNNIVMVVMIQNGSFDEKLVPVLGDQAEAVRSALIDTAPPLFFLSGIERLMIMPVHICLSVIVCLALVKKKPLLLIAAIILHGLVNTPAMMPGSFGMSIYAAEVFILFFSLLAVFGINRLKASFNTVSE